MLSLSHRQPWPHCELTQDSPKEPAWQGDFLESISLAWWCTLGGGGKVAQWVKHAGRQEQEDQRPVHGQPGIHSEMLLTTQKIKK